MELRHLRYFVAVADTLSFTKGAEKLHLAQPSLTRQIKDLEEEIEVRLVDRTKTTCDANPRRHFILSRCETRACAQFTNGRIRSAAEPKRVACAASGYVANLFYDSPSGHARIVPALSSDRPGQSV